MVQEGGLIRLLPQPRFRSVARWGKHDELHINPVIVAYPYFVKLSSYWNVLAYEVSIYFLSCIRIEITDMPFLTEGHAVDGNGIAVMGVRGFRTQRQPVFLTRLLRSDYCIGKREYVTDSVITASKPHHHSCLDPIAGNLVASLAISPSRRPARGN